MYKFENIDWAFNQFSYLHWYLHQQISNYKVTTLQTCFSCSQFHHIVVILQSKKRRTEAAHHSQCKITTTIALFLTMSSPHRFQLLSKKFTNHIRHHITYQCSFFYTIYNIQIICWLKIREFCHEDTGSKWWRLVCQVFWIEDSQFSTYFLLSATTKK